ncbi:hypothetical protein K439DRAFT_1630353 [Ramaria rubella]|nr:hypothetical protein K439DRAFT_1643087 [Ramaria rubella]KAF8587899.1 hypothetical protein K439DRAFT_1630353 [Ramaria rubella]
MTVTRFFSGKFKDEYAGDDDKSKQVREQLFQKHLALYKSRPYITSVQGVHGGQSLPHAMTHGFHYAFVVEFESEEKVAYYNDVDPAHLEFKAHSLPYMAAAFIWAFPPVS